MQHKSIVELQRDEIAAVLIDRTGQIYSVRGSDF